MAYKPESSKNLIIINDTDYYTKSNDFSGWHIIQQEYAMISVVKLT